MEGWVPVVRLHRRWRDARNKDDQLLLAAVVAGIVFLAAATFAVVHPARAVHERATTPVTTRDHNASTTTVGVQVLGETVTSSVPPSTAPPPRHTAPTPSRSELASFARFLAGLRAAPPTPTSGPAPTSATTLPPSSTTTVSVTTTTEGPTTTTTTGSPPRHG